MAESLNFLAGPLMFAVLGVASYFMIDWFIRRSDRLP